MVTHPLWRPYLPRANADRQSQRVVHRQTTPGSLQQHQDFWKDHYAELRRPIESTVPDQVVRLVHTGSTAVRSLVAKPVIDIDLTVPDAGDEMAYVSCRSDCVLTGASRLLHVTRSSNNAPVDEQRNAVCRDQCQRDVRPLVSSAERLAVDALAEEVGVPDVTGVLADQMDVQPAERHRSVVRMDVDSLEVERSQGGPRCRPFLAQSLIHGRGVGWVGGGEGVVVRHG